MLTYVFTLDDLARTRFAISPMFELVGGLRILRAPERAAIHLPWIRTALPSAYELGLEPWLSLMPPRGYVPDFITPPPSTPLTTIEEELELVRATPIRRVRAELEIVARRSGSSPAIEAMQAHPRREVRRLCELFEAFWREAVEPDWSRIHAVLEADLRYRSRRLTEGGPLRLFEDLHPEVSWVTDRLEIRMPWTDTIELAGRGLLLLPAALESRYPVAVADPPWQPTLIYPARGLALLWEPGATCGPAALAALIGGTRADLLTALSAPRSTTELSRLLALSPGGVSQQLAVLRRSGLVEGDRHGRSVLYLRTAAADRLVEGIG
jgi:DNA-binding transcriptional ArsR family regulator